MPILERGAKGFHSLPAVDGDMAFTVALEETLQDYAAGEIVFYNQCFHSVFFLSAKPSPHFAGHSSAARIH
jgi:hypothetical protein